MDARRGIVSLIGFGGLLLLFMVVLPLGAAAQSCDNVDPEIELSLVDLGLGNLDIFYLSDLRASAEGMAPPLFQFSLTNHGAGDRTLTLVLEMADQNGPLFAASTYPFELEAGQAISGTNLELSSSGSIFELGVLDLSDAGGDLEALILSLGFLPSGDFSLRLSLSDTTDGEEISVCSFEFSVSNPRTIELILPGAAFDGALPIESSPFPLFQWRSEATRFDFRLCPVLPGDGSGEETMGNEPAHEGLGFTTAFAGTHTWLYPPGAEVLAEGGRYCWQVSAIVPSSGGDIRFDSEIFCFEMASTATAPGHDEILAMLEELLPPGTLAELRSRLAGLSSTGGITMNHEAISSAELAILLRTLLSSGWEVGNLEIEE
jgi:hypothetical protein